MFRGIEALVCIRHFIANKSVKFGLELWDVANSLTGYIYEFLFYSGKSNETYNYGSVYSIKMKPMEPLLNQGYHLYFDNFFTSVQL